MKNNPYTMFAASDAEGALTVNAGNFCVNGSIATNGTIVASGNMNINGTRTEQANEKMVYIFDKIDVQYFSGSNVEAYTEDYTLEEMNINISNPVEVEGIATLTGNININSALKAFENVELYGEVKNTNESVICSEMGSIIIDSTNVNLNGLVYAPFGAVEITAQNLNLNNVIIIADSITFNCPSVNANYSNSIAEFVGYSPIEIPSIDDVDMTDSDSDGIPDSFEEQYGTDPANSDSDGDGLPDGYELFILSYDPMKIDSDNNGITDGDEDFDSDGLTNIEEFLLGTYPQISDSDMDGISDWDEVNVYGSDPLLIDTDGDGINDGDELLLGFDPTNPQTFGVADLEYVTEQYINSESYLFNAINSDAIVLDGMKEITLDDAITDAYKTAAWKYDEENHSEYSSYADTDEDGLYDFLEVKMLSGLISFDEDGNAVLPTFDDCKEFLEEEYFYVENGLQRYYESLNHDYTTLEYILSVVPVLPINSDPTLEDSDGDTLADTIDNDPLREIGDVSKCWLYHNDYTEIFLALFGEEEYNNYDDHDVYNHRLELQSEVNDEGEEKIYYACTENCCNGSDGYEPVKFLSPSYEDEYMCGDEGLYSDGKYVLIRQLETASLYYMLSGNQKYAEALYHIVDQYRWQNEVDWENIGGFKYQFSQNGKYVSPMSYMYSEEDMDVAVNLSIDYENLAVNELETLLICHSYSIFFGVTGIYASTLLQGIACYLSGVFVSKLCSNSDSYVCEKHTALSEAGAMCDRGSITSFVEGQVFEFVAKKVPQLGGLSKYSTYFNNTSIALAKVSVALSSLSLMYDFGNWNSRWCNNPYYNYFKVGITIESLSSDTEIITSTNLMDSKFVPLIPYGDERDNRYLTFEDERLIKADRINTYKVSATDSELFWLDQNYEVPIVQ